MADFLTVSCRLPADAEERLAQEMERWPVLGCEVADAGDEVDVTVYLDEARAAAVPLVLDGLRALGASALATGHFAERDWLAGYRRHLSPSTVGSRFWIDPDPLSPSPPPPGRVHLVIEPRQAFGTGSHESTQLMLLLLEETELAGARVLDVGTGSGILALAARALGAATVIGCDVDLEAVFVARQTVAGQPSPLPVELIAGSTSVLRASPRFDVILANLLPAQLQPLLGELRALLAPAGTLVVSGLMADQQAAVETELASVGVAAVASRTIGEWVALVCRPHRA